jgi:hypothetical protein
MRHIPYFILKNFTYRVPKVATVLGQAHVDAGSASQYSVVSLPDFVYNVLLQCVSCAQYVTE